MSNNLVLSDPTWDYDILQATVEDEDKLLDFLMSDFLCTESLNLALNMAEEREITERFFREIVQGSLTSDYSYYARSKADGRVIAARLSSVITRPESSSEKENVDENFTFNTHKYSAKIQKIQDFLGAFEEKMWDLVPKDVNKLLIWLVLSVDKDFTRRGIASKLLGIDSVEKLKTDGIQGFITEATAFKSQQLFERQGYDRLYVIKHAEWLDKDGNMVFNCPDGTNKATLEFKLL
ncbi:unnamed protein product [Bursaphelenchus xylophilus]|uniref:aralkylamine N-acetyltransferase n=1 Tax=Bursaphelenchus xylophilus TaxID=6326 RepID=A0A1I7SHI4_BURXY|nr:unnamed protein product [Bursaphelenchus xylophilus]CAG9128780.1 unnamed protein product [Bursaphelenchus xylophilus]